MPSASSPAPAAPNPNVPGKPEGLPDALWDAGTGQVRQTELLSAFNELSKFRSDTEAALGKVPEKPEGYLIPEKLIPDDVKLPDGVVVQIDEKHPLVAPMRELFHKAKMPPEVFGEAAKAFANYELGRELEFHNQLADEDKKLGPNHQVRRDAVRDGLKAAIGEDLAGHLLSNLFTERQVAAAEEILKRLSGQGNVVPLHQKRDNDGPPPSPVPIEEMFYPTMKRG